MKEQTEKTPISNVLSPNMHYHVVRNEKRKSAENSPAVSKKFLEGVVTTSLFALFFGVPLFFLNSTFQGVFFEKQLYFYFCLLVGVIAWVVRGVTSGTLQIRKTPLDIPIWIAWGISFLLLFFSPDTWRSFIGAFMDPSRGFLSISAFVLSYYFILSNATEKRLRMMFFAITLSGGFSVLVSSLVVFGVPFFPKWFPASVMGSFTALGIFLASLLPLFITHLFLRAEFFSEKSESLDIKEKLINGLLLFVLFLDLIVMFALYEYIPWLGVLLGLGVFLLFILSRIIRPSESFAWIPMVVFVGILIILMLGDKIKIAQTNLPQELYPAYSLSWDVAKRAMGENLFFGKGIALYGQAFSSYVPESFFQTPFYQIRPEHAGGLFFETLTTMGVFGGFLLIGIFGIAFVVTMYFLSREQQRNKLFSLGVWAAAVIAVLGCFLTIAHGSILIVMILLCILAMGVIFSESDRESEYFEFSVQASPRFALALSFVSLLLMVGVAFIFVLMGQVFVADVYAGIGARQPNVSVEGSINYYGKAIQLSPKEGYYYLRMGREFLTLSNQEALKPEAERNNDMLFQYLAFSQKSVETGRDLLPENTVAQENVAVVYDGMAFFDPTFIDKAKDAYEKLLKFEPNNPDIYLKLGQIDIAISQKVKEEREKKEKLQSAKEKFSKSLQFRENYPIGHYHLAIVEETLGNQDEAILQMENAVRKVGITNNLSYTFTLARLYQMRNSNDDIDKAKSLFQSILGVNKEEINSLLSLGALHEGKGEKDTAIEYYQKALDILPEESKEAKTELTKFIQNIRDGKSNLSPQTPIPSQGAQPVGEEKGEVNPNVNPASGVDPNQIAPPAPK
ncbi:MAG: hypothetical protein IPN70_01650 [Candidatus Moraniibacteriota bacterium]|nr:MAG: hypothetical protein IPN70_01650 [Candidatus Moranbacteria bacterium]